MQTSRGAAAPPPPDRAGAAQVLAALSALHSGSDAAAADAFLRTHVQGTSAVAAAAALPIVEALLDPDGFGDAGMAHGGGDSGGGDGARSSIGNGSSSPGGGSPGGVAGGCEPALRQAALRFSAAVLENHAKCAPLAVAALARSALATIRSLPAPTAAALSSVAAAPAALAACQADAHAFRTQWALLHQACAWSPPLRCVVDDAFAARVGKLLGAGSAIDIELSVASVTGAASQARFLCSAESMAVMENAATVVLNLDATVRSKIDGIACLRSWLPFSQDVVRLVLDPMVAALALPLDDVASDVGIAIGEAVELLSLSTARLHAPAILAKLCSALRSIYAQEEKHVGIRHAIAEVCVSIADSCADTLLEDAATSVEAQVAVREIVALMMMCVESPRRATFEAATMAWDTWLAAATVCTCSAGDAVVHVLPGLVVAIVLHLHAAQERSAHLASRPLPFASISPIEKVGKTATAKFGASFSSGEQTWRDFADVHDEELSDTDDGDESVLKRVHDVAADTLHQAAQLMSLSKFTQALSDIPLHESTLFALSAAGDVACSEADMQGVSSLITRVVTTAAERNNSACTRKAAFRVLASFAHVLVSSFVAAEWLSSALNVACSSLLELGVEPALLFRELAEVHRARLVPMLHILVEATQVAIGPSVESGQEGLAPAKFEQISLFVQGSTVISENVVHAFALVGSELPEADMRRDALHRIICRPLDRLRLFSASSSASNPAWRGLAAACIPRDLRLIAVAVRNMNDSILAASLLHFISSVLTSIGREHAGDQDVAPALCQLLEACALPTLRDPGEKRGASVALANGTPTASGQSDDASVCAERSGMLVYCIGLASELFLASGSRGESCWLGTLAELARQVLSSSRDDSESSLCAAVQRSVQGVRSFTFFTNEGLQSRPDIVSSFLRFIVVLLDHVNMDGVKVAPAGVAAVRLAVEGIAEIALVSLLYVDDARALHAALSWWQRVVSEFELRDLGQRAVAHVGGAQHLCDALIQTVPLQRGSRRGAHLAADAILDLQKHFEGQSPLMLTRGFIARSGSTSLDEEQTLSSLSAILASGHKRNFEKALLRLRTACLAGVVA